MAAFDDTAEPAWKGEASLVLDSDALLVHLMLWPDFELFDEVVVQDWRCRATLRSDAGDLTDWLLRSWVGRIVEIRVTGGGTSSAFVNSLDDDGLDLVALAQPLVPKQVPDRDPVGTARAVLGWAKDLEPDDPGTYDLAVGRIAEREAAGLDPLADPLVVAAVELAQTIVDASNDPF